MNKYNKQINMKTIVNIFRRRMIIFATVFMVIAASSALITQVFLPKKYESCAAFSCDTIYSNHYSEIQAKIKNSSVAERVEACLTSDNIHYYNGKNITQNDIYNGIGFSHFSGQTINSFSIKFESADMTVVKSVLAAIVDVVKSSIGYGSQMIESPSDPIKTSKESTYFVVCLVVGLIFSFGFCFEYEIIADTVYDSKDIDYLGSDGFEIKAS